MKPDDRIYKNMSTMHLMELFFDNYARHPYSTLIQEKQKELAIRTEANELSENEESILFLNVKESKTLIDRSLLLAVLNKMSTRKKTP